MYDVIMINLAADARAANPDGGRIERRGVSSQEMCELLQNFCEIDAVENATVDPELRVQVNGQSYQIRAELKKLILSNIHTREAASELLEPDQVMAELDGTANTARILSVQTRMPFLMAPPPTVVMPAPPRRHTARLLAMSGVIGLLLGAIVYLRISNEEPNAIEGFVTSTELNELESSLPGVYLTGTEPGHHGIVYFATGELRLFELRSLAAPQMVYATAKVGRIGSSVYLATDQPGGLVAVSGPDLLVYCGETYRRVQ